MLKMKSITTALNFCIMVLALLTNCQAQTEKDQVAEQKKSDNNSGQNLKAPSSEDISSEEVSAFISASRKLRGQQQHMQLQAMKMIEESAIDLEKYKQIAKSQQNQKSGETAFTEEEMRAYNNISQDISELEKEARKKSELIIQNEGMKIERFRQIVQVVKQDTTLQKRMQTEMQNRMQDKSSGQSHQQPAAK
jgi:hypothetical protein